MTTGRAGAGASPGRARAAQAARSRSVGSRKFTGTWRRSPGRAGAPRGGGGRHPRSCSRRSHSRRGARSPPWPAGSRPSGRSTVLVSDRQVRGSGPVWHEVGRRIPGTGCARRPGLGSGSCCPGGAVRTSLPRRSPGAGGESESSPRAGDPQGKSLRALGSRVTKSAFGLRDGSSGSRTQSSSAWHSGNVKGEGARGLLL